MSELKFKNTSIGYDKEIILENINTTLPKGKLVALLGENGSGKTTLFKSILGLNDCLKGSIEYNNKPIQDYSSNERASIFSVVFSRLNQVPNVTVLRLLSLGRIPYQGFNFKLNNRDKKLIENALELTEITDLKDKFCTELSDGQLQKVLIARALVQDTPIVLMDEPTSHLDLKNRFKVFELIKQLSEQTNKTFLVSTHEIQMALQMSDWIWWLNEKQLYDGFPEEIAFHHQLYEQFSAENISYNYKQGRFQIQQTQKRKINFQGNDSQLSCWVEHGLLRLGFEFDSNAKQKVQVSENLILFNDSKYDSLSEFINAITPK